MFKFKYLSIVFFNLYKFKFKFKFEFKFSYLSLSLCLSVNSWSRAAEWWMAWLVGQSNRVLVFEARSPFESGLEFGFLVWVPYASNHDANIIMPTCQLHVIGLHVDP